VAQKRVKYSRSSMSIRHHSERDNLLTKTYGRFLSKRRRWSEAMSRRELWKLVKPLSQDRGWSDLEPFVPRRLSSGPCAIYSTVRRDRMAKAARLVTEVSASGGSNGPLDGLSYGRFGSVCIGKAPECVRSLNARACPVGKRHRRNYLAGRP
jgi:hypothetical protein